MDRRLAREAAMCLFYEREIRGYTPEESAMLALGDVLGKEQLNDDNFTYIDKMLTIFEQNLSKIDELISANCRGWKLSRLSKIDLSILRLAAAEIYYLNEYSYKVSINEAVEMAKKFSEDKSPAFINGVLGAMIEKIPQGEMEG